jgi:hypothetical protein
MKTYGYELSESKPTFLSRIKNFFGIKYQFVYSRPLDIDSFVNKNLTDTTNETATAPPQTAPSETQSISSKETLEPSKSSHDNNSSSPTNTQDSTSPKGP